MTRAIFVLKAQKDYPEHDIKKGDSYYWWKFRFGGKHYSKTPPKPSQLTQSGFKQSLYDIEERIRGVTVDDDLEAFIEDMKGELESLRDECQSSLDNMPEHLQESSSSGEMLTNRVESLDSMIDEFGSIDATDTDVDEDDIKETTKEENPQNEGESDEDYSARIEELATEIIEEETNNRKEEILGSIQDICYNGD